MSRIARSREELIRPNLHNFIVTRLSNIRYLYGFPGSTGTHPATPEKVRFFNDFHDQKQTSKQAHDAELILCRNDLFQELRRRPVRLKEKTNFKAGLYLPEFKGGRIYDAVHLLSSGFEALIRAPRV